MDPVDPEHWGKVYCVNKLQCEANLSESQVGEAGPPDSPKREEEEEE